MSGLGRSLLRTVIILKVGVELEMEHVKMVFEFLKNHRQDIGMCIGTVGFIYNVLKSKEAKLADIKEKVKMMSRSPLFAEVLTAELLKKDSKNSKSIVEADESLAAALTAVLADGVGAGFAEAQLEESKKRSQVASALAEAEHKESKMSRVGAALAEAEVTTEEKVGKILTEEMNLDDADKAVEMFSRMLRRGNIKKMTMVMEVEEKELKWTVEEKLA